MRYVRISNYTNSYVKCSKMHILCKIYNLNYANYKLESQDFGFVCFWINNAVQIEWLLLNGQPIWLVNCNGSTLTSWPVESCCCTGPLLWPKAVRFIYLFLHFHNTNETKFQTNVEKFKQLSAWEALTRSSPTAD